jgi:hypothetical protein
MDTNDKSFDHLIKDINDPTINTDPDTLNQLLSYIDQEHIDRIIDMLHKIKTLAHEKAFNINQYLEKYGNIKTLPTEEEILKKPQELIPIIEEELKKIFINLTT